MRSSTMVSKTYGKSALLKEISDEEPLIPQKEAKILKKAGLLEESELAPYWLRLSSRILTDINTQYEPGRSRICFNKRQPDDIFVRKTRDHIEVPLILESKETIEYIGFTQEKAELIWDTWCRVQEEYPVQNDFFPFVVSYVYSSTKEYDARSRSDDWVTCLDRVGLNEELKGSIMLELFADIRCTGSSSFWAKVFLEGRYEGLQAIATKAIRRANMMKEEKELEKKTENWIKKWMKKLRMTLKPQQHRCCKECNIERAKAKKMLKDRSNRRREEIWLEQQLRVQKVMNSDEKPWPSVPSRELKLNQVTIAPDSRIETHSQGSNAAFEPWQKSGSLRLFRTSTATEAAKIYDEKTRQINVELSSVFSGDLGGVKRFSYWALQRDLANKYAAWFKHTMPHAEIVVMEAVVSEEWIQNKDYHCLWALNEDSTMNEKFQEHVWNSRQWKRSKNQKLDYLTEAEMVFSNIHSGVNTSYSGNDDFHQITATDILKVTNIVGGKIPAIQLGLNSCAWELNFDEECEGKIRIYNLGTKIISPEDIFPGPKTYWGEEGKRRY